MKTGNFGRYFQMNINNPSSEKTYLKVENDGSIFSSLGETIVVGGWMKPTTYSVGNTYTSDLEYPLRFRAADFLSVADQRKTEDYAV